ncbi:exported hypothetical protein [Candidatus Magnetomoraceae bacterium gMMP-1]
MSFKNLMILFLSFLFVGVTVHVQAYENQSQVISAGGRWNDDYKNFGVLGEPIVNKSSTGGDFIAKAGFVYKLSKTTSKTPPDWIPVLNQQYNMNVIAQLKIQDILSTNSNDILGAFVGEECRGVASPVTSLNGIMFLTVSSNVQSGETITFKAWNSTTGEELNVAETLAFQDQHEEGALDNPFIFNAGLTEITINFGAGYTWFSVNANPGSMDCNDLFSNLTPAANDRIIGQTSFAVYSGSQWVGSLSTIDPKKMYKMKLSMEQEWSKQGQPILPSSNPINLGAGYNWIGYLPQKQLEINNALENLTPTANNRVIGQTKFAVYSGSSWIGSLLNLEIGNGYKIKVSNNSTLIYPDNSGRSARTAKAEHNLKLGMSRSAPNWIPETNLQFNMNIIAKLQTPNGNFSTNGADVIGAFVDDECRGIANPTPSYEGFIFLTVGSNIQSGEIVKFKAYVADTNLIYDINGEKIFQDQADIGTLDNPKIFTLCLNPTNINKDNSTAQSEELSISNTTFLKDNGDSITFGHTTTTCSSVATDLTGTDLKSRLSREWYLDINDEGSNGGNIKIIFNFGENNHPTIRGSEYFLIYRADTEGAYSKTINSISASYTTQHTVVFDNIDITQLIDGYYTLGCTNHISPVTFISFAAKSCQNHIVLEWETETEIDTAGFHILRSDSIDGEYIRITNQVIPNKGFSFSGDYYFYIDNNVLPGKTYYYKLEDIETDNTRNLSDPVTSEKWSPKLEEVIFMIQILSGFPDSKDNISNCADINTNSKVDLGDVIYMLQYISEIGR